MIELFGLKPIDLDAMPWLDIGPHSLAEPMGRAIERLDTISLDSVLQRLARRYPIAQDAAGIRSGALVAGALESYTKSYGLVICPTFDKASGATAQKVQNVVDIIFNQGEVAFSTINR